MGRGGFPSMTALLGLLAVAGYQNRDKISEMISSRSGAGNPDSGNAGGADRQAPGRSPDQHSGLDGMLGGFLGGLGIDKLLGGGLSELNNHFRQNGHAHTVDSWVGKGSNHDLTPDDLEKALGNDTLDDLTEQTGLSRGEVLARLARELPNAVDQYTPDGKLPQWNG